MTGAQPRRAATDDDGGCERRGGARHVILVGLMGSGKTTIGQLVAARLDRPFLDSDAIIEAETGRTVREIFEAEGEPAFRAIEAEVLDATLSAEQPSVVAAAGGTVLDARNRARMHEAGTVVWLRADPSVLIERVAGAEHRPLLDHDPAVALAQMASDRDELYREMADVTVEVADRPPEAVADIVVAAVGAAA